MIDHDEHDGPGYFDSDPRKPEQRVIGWWRTLTGIIVYCYGWPAPDDDGR